MLCDINYYSWLEKNEMREEGRYLEVNKGSTLELEQLRSLQLCQKCVSPDSSCTKQVTKIGFDSPGWICRLSQKAITLLKATAMDESFNPAPIFFHRDSLTPRWKPTQQKLLTFMYPKKWKYQHHTFCSKIASFPKAT